MTEVLHIQQYWQLEDLYNEQDEPSGNFQRVLLLFLVNDGNKSIRYNLVSLVCIEIHIF